MKRHSFNLLCLLMILAMLVGCSRRHYRPSVKDVLKHNPALEQECIVGGFLRIYSALQDKG